MLELDPDFDADNRQLCPDGSCVGVIGPDGRCKICGLSADGTLRAEEPALAEADAPAAFDDEDRQLCPDGSCVGLLGPDGRCKVCGRSS